MTNNLSRLVKETRIKKGLSQGQIAIKADLDRTTICKIESGERKKPLPDTLSNLSFALDLEFYDLLVAAGYTEDEINEVMKQYEEEEPNYEALFSYKIILTGAGYVDAYTRKDIDNNIDYILSQHISNLLGEAEKNHDLGTDNKVEFCYKIESCDWE